MNKIKATYIKLSILALVAWIIVPLGTQAAQITARSLTLGTSTSAAVTSWNFAFTVPTTSNVGSVSFEVCTLAVGSCVAPGGWTNAGATLASTTGLGSGWSADLTTAGQLRIANTTATSVTGPQAITANWTGITNPSTSSQPFTFYVRITTYSDLAYTTPVDLGNVAAAIIPATFITLTGQMPESLIFCVAETITGTDCTSATDGAVSFNQLFSPTSTAIATSQMVASTNGATGYVVSVQGPTLTSGGFTIPALTSQTASAFGGVTNVSQFGMNLVDNTTPNVGVDIAPSSNVGLKLNGRAVPNYATVDQYRYVSGDTVADSNFAVGADPDPSNAQAYTVAYIVNVSGAQEAGVYTTTLVYTCTATF